MLQIGAPTEAYPPPEALTRDNRNRTTGGVARSPLALHRHRRLGEIIPVSILASQEAVEDEEIEAGGEKER